MTRHGMPKSDVHRMVGKDNNSILHCLRLQHLKGSERKALRKMPKTKMSREQVVDGSDVSLTLDFFKNRYMK